MRRVVPLTKPMTSFSPVAQNTDRRVVASASLLRNVMLRQMKTPSTTTTISMGTIPQLASKRLQLTQNVVDLREDGAVKVKLWASLRHVTLSKRQDDVCELYITLIHTVNVSARVHLMRMTRKNIHGNSSSARHQTSHKTISYLCDVYI